MANVVLADDHPLFLEALRDAVERAGVNVVGTAHDGDELLELMAHRGDVDAVILDLAMPVLDGFICLERLRDTRPDVVTIVVSGSTNEDDIQRAVDLGAACFVGKAADPADVAAAIRVILLDSVRIPNADRRDLRGSRGRTDAERLLTRRELEILRLAAEGRSNAEIAASLWVTEQTVKFHLSNTYRKIGVSNRTGAGRWAQQHGLV